MSTSTLSVRSDSADRAGSRRLAVAWQHPVSRRIEAVGLLSCDVARFSFSYLRRASTVEGFQPFLGFPDLLRRYDSPFLFPLFAQRVMRPTRPDFGRYSTALALEEGAEDWSILGRSQGQREGDGIRVFTEPVVDEAGATTATFFVSGVRHRMRSRPEVGRALEGLALGDRLALVDEPDNPTDPQALLVAERAGVALGWVPSVLLPYVHTTRSVAEPTLEVTRTNGTDVPPSFRLLVTLRGSVPPGYAPFSGASWALAPSS